MTDRVDPWTSTELAKAANVTDGYIRRLLIAGKLQGRKFGHIWLIPAEDGQQWLEERRVKWEKF